MRGNPGKGEEPMALNRESGRSSKHDAVHEKSVMKGILGECFEKDNQLTPGILGLNGFLCHDPDEFFKCRPEDEQEERARWQQVMEAFSGRSSNLKKERKSEGRMAWGPRIGTISSERF